MHHKKVIGDNESFGRRAIRRRVKNEESPICRWKTDYLSSVSRASMK